jgi:hypothetical protein
VHPANANNMLRVSRGAVGSVLCVVALACSSSDPAIGIACPESEMTTLTMIPSLPMTDAELPDLVVAITGDGVDYGRCVDKQCEGVTLGFELKPNSGASPEDAAQRSEMVGISGVALLDFAVTEGHVLFTLNGTTLCDTDFTAEVYVDDECPDAIPRAHGEVRCE